MEWIIKCSTGISWLTGILVLVTTVLIYVFQRGLKQLWEYYVLSGVNRDGFEDLPLPPGTMGYPLIGETFQFLKKKCGFYTEKAEKYGMIYKTHMLGRPMVRVIGAENVRTILMGENSLVTSNWPTSTQLLLGAGSISQSSGNAHKIRRKHMLHAFSLDTLNDMIPEMQELIHKALRDWRRRKEVYCYPECKSLAFSIAACTLVGLDVSSTEKYEMHTIFINFLRNIMSIPLDLPGFGFRKGMNAKRQLICALRELLPCLEKRPYTPVMKAYYMACRKLDTESDETIYEGILDLLFAGHETVASTTTNCVMFLGQNKNVVGKLRSELERHGLLDTENNFNDLNYKIVGDLKYLNNVVREVLRLCPPAGAGFRRALKSFEMGGYLIPKDWTVMFSIRETQQMSPLFDHADMFDPDRWDKIDSMPDSEKKFHYIPFGSGSRGCVGKMYAQLLVKIFVIELVRTSDWCLKNKNVTLTYIPIPVATDHLPVRFRERGEDANRF